MWKTSVTCTTICSQIDRGIPFSVYPSSAPHPGRYMNKTFVNSVFLYLAVVIICLYASPGAREEQRFPKLVISIALIGLIQNSTRNNSYLTFHTLIFTMYTILLTQIKHLNIGYMPLIQYMTNMHHLKHKE